MAIYVKKVNDTVKFCDTGGQTIGGFIDQFNNLCYYPGKYCFGDFSSEVRKVPRLKEALSGTMKYSNITDMILVMGRNLEALQDRFRIKEVELTPPQ